MNILYYITAHGYGHAMRAGAVCKEFTPGVQVFFRTLIPQKFFEEEMRRPFGYFPEQFDCGCLQRDSLTVEWEKTLQTYREIAARNEARLKDEIQWCLDHGVDGIVSDIPPFAFEVARKAGLPSVGISNFTWYDIYEPFGQNDPGFQPYLKKIRNQYQMADFLLELWPSNGMSYFKNRVQVPLVGRKGHSVRDRLTKELALPGKKHLGMIYVGELGMDSILWSGLEKFREWDFVGIYPLPGAPANYHLVKKEDFLYQDLTASVDVMISKIGYGTFAECLLNGTPLLYLPRQDFAEYPALEKAVVEWGYGFCLPREDYCALNWEEALAKVVRQKRAKPLHSEGARLCARKIEEIVHRGIPPARPSRRD